MIFDEEWMVKMIAAEMEERRRCAFEHSTLTYAEIAEILGLKLYQIKRAVKTATDKLSKNSRLRDWVRL